MTIGKVNVHPLVLLSVCDHYTRVAKNTGKRVVGVLLGTSGDEVNITNSFALPFEEDEKDQGVFFLDQDFLSSFHAMFRKINAKEKVVGWYHTGQGLKPSDASINALIAQHCVNPVLVLVTVAGEGIPATAYCMDNGGFVNLKTGIVAEEAEEIGVEQLLRDIRREGRTSLVGMIVDKGRVGESVGELVGSVKTLGEKLGCVKEYLGKVVAGERKVNQEVCYALQDMLNVLPVPNGRSVITTTNDQMAVMYMAALGRSVVKLHALIDNKIQNEI